jgi:ABC-type sugar transport system ATPase subunit
VAEIRLESVSKDFGAVRVVDDVDLTIEEGSFTVLLGPSGCGKSTTLNMIAGLEEVTSGRILFDGDEMQDRAPHRRDIAMVFQSYALYPNRSVRENIAFGLRIARVPKKDIAQRVQDVAARLELTPLLDRKPRQLSGGQQQRVALARAIVRRPRAFLLDEPLSNLDAKLRADMRIGLKELQQELSGTFVYVTHDQTEAMSMADRVVVMRDGRIQQVDDPLGLYLRPANRFVAAFVGSPTMNQIEGEVEARSTFRVGEWACPVAGEPRPGPAVLGLRAEAIRLRAAAEGVGQVRVVERLGVESLVAVALPFGDLVARTGANTTLQPGDRVDVATDAEQAHLFDAETGARLPTSPPAVLADELSQTS